MAPLIMSVGAVLAGGLAAALLLALGLRAWLKP